MAASRVVHSSRMAHVSVRMYEGKQEFENAAVATCLIINGSMYCQWRTIPADPAVQKLF